MEHRMVASPRDTIAVLASQMQISEYEVFQHAHQCWYGKETTCDIEHEFGQFLLHAELPVWVRHFVRDNLVLPEYSTPRGRTVFLSGYMSGLGYRAFLRRTARRTNTDLLVA